MDLIRASLIIQIGPVSGNNAMGMAMNLNDTTVVILAGGQARRMGGEDKGLIRLGDRPLIEYIIAALKHQAGTLIINANRHHADYARYGFAVVADEEAGFRGPLAGMASALTRIDTDYMATVPCDSPFIPPDLVARLLEALLREAADISVAHDGRRMQPVFCLLKRSLGPALNDYLGAGGRKIDHWFARHKLACADFSDRPGAFANINTPLDIEQARARLGLAEDAG